MLDFQSAGFIFFAALLIAVLVTPMSIYLAEAAGAIDHPDRERKHHGRAVPRLGGLAIALAFLTPTLGVMALDRHLLSILGGAAIIVLTGLLDDLIQLRAIIKLAAQILAASCLVVVGGISLTGFGNLFGLGPIDTGIWGPWITVFCIVGVINAMNLCDGLDGLAAGFAVIACIFFAMMAFDHHNWLCLMLLLALMGGSLGFLRYNTHPARLFMGDVGSMLLGYGLATCAVLLVRPESQHAQAIAPVTVAIVLALPILDTLIVMVRRILRRKMPFAADRTHIHHRIMAVGLSHDQTVMLLYTGMTAFGCLALSVKDQPEWVQFVSALCVATALFASLAVFEHMQEKQRWHVGDQPHLLQTFAFYTSHHMGWLHRSTLPVSLLALGLIGVASVTSPSPGNAMFAMLSAVFGSVLLLYPWHLYPWRPDREHAAVQKGVIYLMVVTLFLNVHLHAVAWQKDLLAVLAVLSLLVALGRASSWSADTHGPSSFQVLILLNMAIIPLLLLPRVNLDDLRCIAFACLEAMPVAWLLNGYSGRIYQRNRRITLLLLGFMALLLIKSGTVGVMP